MFGLNLEIDDIDAISVMDRLCDDYGLDTIETGSALAVAAEAGVMDFGDAEKANGLIEEMGQGTVLGRVLGQGAAVAARVLGVSRVAAVKGQALPAHEPRVLKCTGFTLANSPMGADHTAGMVFDAGVPKDKVKELSTQAQVLCALVDSTGCCQIAFGVPGTAIPLITKMLNSIHGLELTEEDVINIGKNV